LIEIVAVSVHEIVVQIFNPGTSLHSDDGISSWVPLKDDLFWEFSPNGAWTTLFRRAWYVDHER